MDARLERRKRQGRQAEQPNADEPRLGDADLARSAPPRARVSLRWPVDPQRPRRRIPAITVLLAVFVIYVLGLVIAGQRLGWWNPDLAKDSVIWFLTVGFPTWFNVQGASEDGFFRRTALRTIGIGAVVGFYLNLTAFSLPVELGFNYFS